MRTSIVRKTAEGRYAGCVLESRRTLNCPSVVVVEDVFAGSARSPFQSQSGPSTLKSSHLLLQWAPSSSLTTELECAAAPTIC